MIRFGISISLSLLLCSATGFAQPTPGARAQASPPALIVTAVVEAGELPLPQTLVGSAEPRYRAEVAAEVDGLVQELPVRRGDRVAKGAVLVRLRTFRLELQIEEERAALGELRARIAKAETDLNRARDLFAQRFISEQELQSRQTDRDALNQAELRQQARLRSLEDRLGRMMVRAPFNGEVVRTATEIGQWLAAGDQVLELADLSLIQVMVPVPEQLLFRLGLETPAEVRFDALPGTPFSGRVTAIVPQADPASRTFPVQVSVANPEGAILAGMLARVSFNHQLSGAQLLVPKDAYVVRPDGSGYVVRVSDGAAHLVSVKVLAAVGQRFAVQPLEGQLASGDRIVIRGNERLRPGQPVREAAGDESKGNPL